MRWMLLLFLLFLVACSSPVPGEVNATQVVPERSEPVYQQALQNLSVNTTNLALRYTAIDNRVEAVLAGEELTMASFVAIKIELDFLQSQHYNATQIQVLRNKFAQAYNLASDVGAVDGSSLTDRYIQVNRTVEKWSKDSSFFSVAEYLQVEKSLDLLQADGYIDKRIEDLRNVLVGLVIGQLQYSIANFGVPDINESAEILPVTSLIAANHTVYLIDGGFGQESIVINQGDTVIWQNIRGGQYKVALLVGNGRCRNLKSGFFGNGASFSMTFDEPLQCYVADGIFTTQAMKIVVRGKDVE